MQFFILNYYILYRISCKEIYTKRRHTQRLHIWMDALSRLISANKFSLLCVSFYFTLYKTISRVFNYLTVYLILLSLLNLLHTKYKDRISQCITHINLTTFFNHFRVFFHYEPADVREKESSVAVMWVCVRIRVLVVHPMISHSLFCERWQL